jgi:asparaginyl-tRNA synthetase
MNIKEIFRDTGKYINKDISVNGWVRTLRDSKSFGFIELNDGSFFENLQIVFEEANLKNFKEIAKLPVGASIRASGKLVATPEAKQPFELKATQIDIEGTCAQDYPLQKKTPHF